MKCYVFARTIKKSQRKDFLKAFNVFLSFAKESCFWKCFPRRSQGTCGFVIVRLGATETRTRPGVFSNGGLDKQISTHVPMPSSAANKNFVVRTFSGIENYHDMLN